MKDNIASMISNSPMSTTDNTPQYNRTFANNKGSNESPQKASFFNNLTQIFGFKRKSANKAPGIDNMEFVKVDANSKLQLAQARIAKTFSTKLTGKLEDLFDSWLRDTTDTVKILEDRNKRLSEITFAITNDPFLSMAVSLYADEATQIDVQGNLISVECADSRMKQTIENLFVKWGITQNRLRAVAYNLAGWGDAFWSNKVTTAGVARINPLKVEQVKERLEFNPVQVQTDIALRKGYTTAINRSAKLKALFDTMDDPENEEFADMFDTRLFGFAIDDDMVVPPWVITHFRLTPDQSEYAPMGRSLFLHTLAPFRQCNATMVLQSLARVMSFPVTVYTVKTPPGMDEALQFDRINEVREEYEAVGATGAGNEAFSVNTKIWAPEGLLHLDMLTPTVPLFTDDIQMYQDRVAIASGVPKGYLVQEWGGFGNSAISLTEQFKPFARRVYTIQSAMIDGLANLVRLHFAITGAFDYRSDFVLSMKFPNEETSDARQAAKQNSLNLTKDVLETIASIVGSLNNPLPPEVIKDILTKFSFLTPEDINKWVKENPNQKEQDTDNPEELDGGDMGGGGSISGGGGMEGGMGGEELGGEEGGLGEEPMGAGGEDGTMPSPEEGGMPAAQPGAEEELKQEHYFRMEANILRERKTKRLQERKRIVERYTESKTEIYQEVIRKFSQLDEATINYRHYKFCRVEECNIPMYELFQKKTPVGASPNSNILREVMQEEKELKGLSWNQIRESIESMDSLADDDEDGFEDENKDIDYNHE